MLNRIRKRLYEITEVAEKDDIPSRIYDALMVMAVLASLAPLLAPESRIAVLLVEQIAISILLFDYFLLWFCADFSMGKRYFSFILYPFTLGSIINLLAIIPPYLAMHDMIDVRFSHYSNVLQVLIALRLLKLLRITKYFKQFYLIVKVLKKQKQALMVVLTLAVAYILVVALIMYVLEGEYYNNYFEAIYWATVSLTSVGYGDFVPHTTAGRLLTILSSVMGIAIIALPSGIISAGYMDELNKMIAEEKRKQRP